MQRLLVYSPLGVLIGVSLAARVASEQAGAGHKMPPSVPPASSGNTRAHFQQPRDFDATRLSALKTLSLLAATPPSSLTSAAVPSASALSAAKASASGKAAAAPKELAVGAQIASVTTKVLPDPRVSLAKVRAGKANASYVAEKAPPLRKPEAWTPPIAFGPPLPPERVHAQKQAHQLCKDREAGRLTLTMDERDGEQLRLLERDGIFCWPAPPTGVVIRSPRQRAILDGTTDLLALPAPSGMQLASRGALLDAVRPGNPADDPDFDPCTLPPSPLLLGMLTTLAGHSTPARPLQLLSLLRPPYRTGGFVHVGAANPHSLGLAADIGAYGGHEIRQAQPEACVAAALALLRDLPPGRYRLGMPKAPEGGWDMPPQLIALLNSPPEELLSARPAPVKPTNAAKLVSSSQPAQDEGGPQPVESESPGTASGGAIAAWYGLYASSAKPVWPFFPPPFTEVVLDGAAEETDADAPTSSGTVKPINSRRGNMARTVTRFQNESYAPESGLRDPRLRYALEMARKRGVDVVAMFPDGADHIHIDVRQNP